MSKYRIEYYVVNRSEQAYAPVHYK